MSALRLDGAFCKEPLAHPFQPLTAPVLAPLREQFHPRVARGDSVERDHPAAAGRARRGCNQAIGKIGLRRAKSLDSLRNRRIVFHNDRIDRESFVEHR